MKRSDVDNGTTLMNLLIVPKQRHTMESLKKLVHVVMAMYNCDDQRLRQDGVIKRIVDKLDAPVVGRWFKKMWTKLLKSLDLRSSFSSSGGREYWDRYQPSSSGSKRALQRNWSHSLERLPWQWLIN
ncbi:MAG: hypothetical protein COA68_12295 [Oceanobacter sp.]|nr:MAG: hypothetical protein COA68_12295 [Oceanobacter sp.]